MYLLQLVQALKFESIASDQRSARSTSSAISYDDSGLADFLIGRAVRNPILGNRFYWYLMVEVALEDRVVAKMYGRVVFRFQEKMLKVRLSDKLSLCTELIHTLILHSLRTVPNVENLCVDKANSLILYPNAVKNFEYPKILDPRR